MRRLCVIAVLILAPMLLLASMNDTAALKKAQQLWGLQGHIAPDRSVSAANWTRGVGVNSDNCKVPFTILGSGYNTWDAAFADYEYNLANGTSPRDKNGKPISIPVVIHGPYKNILTLTPDVSEPPGVTAAQIYIDGVSQGPESPLGVTVSIDTTKLAKGIHVMCTASRTIKNELVGSQAWLFSIDQSAGTVASLVIPELGAAYQLHIVSNQ